MHIILDFDYTLFNTALLKDALKRECAKYGVSEELFCSSLEASKGGGSDYKPDRQFEILHARGIWNISDIRRAFDGVLQGGRTFLYGDTLSFLENVKRKNLLALVTYGDDAFQKAKVNGCGAFAQYFERIVITQNIAKDKEATVLSGGKKAVFIDDNPAALFAVKKRAPHIRTVRMRRGDGPYEDEASREGVDYEVSALKELEDIVLAN